MWVSVSRCLIGSPTFDSARRDRSSARFVAASARCLRRLGVGDLYRFSFGCFLVPPETVLRPRVGCPCDGGAGLVALAWPLRFGVRSPPSVTSGFGAGVARRVCRRTRTSPREPLSAGLRFREPDWFPSLRTATRDLRYRRDCQ
jgi:hypothetical protein